MGVPAFFRWLTKKYPSVIVPCIEERVKNIDGTEIPVNTAAPNPNGVEFDNLYLDMNGIIHPCTHPEDKPAPKNEDEMMIAIFECIDRLFRIVRPRKILYMAIDGVAPRAKMNQQRSRRFRASKETNEKIAEMERIRAELTAKGCILPPAKPSGSHFDSNCITPGTPFMDRLAQCLHFYIHKRLNSDPGWYGLKVILSDANSPGEGEHKIMDFIRRQRAQPDHDPNTHHCLCGADADLIMLGLATHEPNFTIIREEFKPNQQRPCDICGQMGHDMKDCMGLEMECPEDGPGPKIYGSEPEFIFVRISVLREYLETELNIPNLPFTFDLERAVDDWVLMCFFVGNDFLPHLPSLEIREGAIDRLVTLYKKTVYKTGGYLTDSGIVNLNRVQLILADLGEVEDEIFKNRQQNEIKFKARMKHQKKRRFDGNGGGGYGNRPSFTPRGQYAPTPIGNRPGAIQNPRQEAFNMRVQGMHTSADRDVQRSNQDAAAALKALLKIGTPDSGFNSSGSGSSSANASLMSSSPSPNTSVNEIFPKRKASTVFKDSDSDEENNDEVRLWEAGFKDRYYESKFQVSLTNLKFRQAVAHEYVRGLCWVLRYYYQGCASWSWYFPYHYAPFASDFINIGDLSTEFEKNTKPFEPLEQLMGVFPAASRSHVPEPWGKLMYDPESPIIDFYPEDFQIDLNGKKFAWQGVALLPFVDEVRLKQVLANYYKDLTEEELRRNQRGDDRLYVRRGYAGYDFLVGLYENQMSPNAEITHDAKTFHGMGGTVLLAKEVVPFEGELRSPIKGLHDIFENQVTCVRFRDPKYKDDYIFPAVRLPNAIDPPKVLRPKNLTEEEARNWRPQIGMGPRTTKATLDISGHRALAHAGYPPRGGERDNRYSNVPPPIAGSNNARSYNGVAFSASSYDNGSRSNLRGGSSSGSRGGYIERGGGRGGGGSGRYESSYNNYGGGRGGGGYGSGGYSGSSNYYGTSGGGGYQQGGGRNGEQSYYGGGRSGGASSYNSRDGGYSRSGGNGGSSYAPGARGSFAFQNSSRGNGPRGGGPPRNDGYYTVGYNSRQQ